MALTPGATVPGTTTLAGLIDLIYANKSASITSATAVFTALEPSTLMANWPAVDTGGNALYIRVNARPVLPQAIAT